MTTALTPADVPYELNPAFLEELFTKHRIDYVVHGDDPCLLPDGSDAYAHAKEMGRFKMVSTSAPVIVAAAVVAAVTVVCCHGILSVIIMLMDTQIPAACYPDVVCDPNSVLATFSTDNNLSSCSWQRVSDMPCGCSSPLPGRAHVYALHAVD